MVDMVGDQTFVNGELVEPTGLRSSRGNKRQVFASAGLVEGGPKCPATRCHFDGDRRQR
jgi:hypothetical protein